MNTNDFEAPFIVAVQREFGFLVREHNFTAEPFSWDGRGISVIHRHERYDVVNHLEGDTSYSTWLFPLRAGQRFPLVDSEGDEPFAFFSLADLSGEAGLRENRPPKTPFDLEDEVSQRARVLHAHIGRLLGDSGELHDIRERIRIRELGRLVPRWRGFVGELRLGFEGSVSEYVAGVNVRGQIRSLAKWSNGHIPKTLQSAIDLADAEFDSLTVPMAPDAASARHRPHPRALRWWRMPETPKGKLRDYFFRQDAASDR